MISIEASNEVISVEEDARIIGCNNTIIARQPVNIRVFGDNNKISSVQNGRILGVSGKGAKNRLRDGKNIAILDGTFDLIAQKDGNITSQGISNSIITINGRNG